MSIAAANTFTRNIYKEWINPDATIQQEAKVSKIASLVVKAFALIFVLTMDKQNAINLQLLGGIWILQTLPVHRVQPLHAVVPPVGAARRLGGRHDLRHGRGVGTSPARRRRTSVARSPPIPVSGQMGYIAVTAFVLNVVVAAILTLILRAAKAPAGVDSTQPADYFADEGDPRVAPMPKSVEELAAEGKTQR